jgi:hypothetical protein
MNEKKITGVRVYVLTVDSETNTVLKCEEEDPNTGHRAEPGPDFKGVPAQYAAPETLIPPGFVPSIVILVGGQVSAISQSPSRERWTPIPILPHGRPPSAKQAAEDKQGEPPKV